MTDYVSHSDKYPYLVIHAMSGVYAVRHPEKSPLTREQMIQWAKDESIKYNRGTCVVFSAKEAVYIEIDGKVKYSDDIPAGGVILTN